MAVPIAFQAGGPAWSISYQQMVDVLQGAQLSIQLYKEAEGIFVIKNASKMDSDRIRRILDAYIYRVWKPNLLETRDDGGNPLVTLIRV